MPDLKSSTLRKLFNVILIGLGAAIGLTLGFSATGAQF